MSIVEFSREDTMQTEAETLTRLHSLPPCALFRTDEAALYGGFRTDLLRAWRWQGRGPAHVGKGHLVRYRKADLDAFLGVNVEATA